MLGAKAGDDAEANQHDYPRVAFVRVHQVVAKDTDNERQQREDQDCHGFWEMAVANIIQDIRTGNGIDHGPSNADDSVKDRHEFRGPPPCTGVSRIMTRVKSQPFFCSVMSKIYNVPKEKR
jgi:hypothetical protein